MKKRMIFALIVCVFMAPKTSASERYKSEVIEQGEVKLIIFSPAYLQPGSVILISLEGLATEKEIKAEFDGKKIPVLSLNGKKWCLLAVDVYRKTGAIKFLLYKKDGKLFERNFAVKELTTPSVPFRKPPAVPKKERRREIKIMKDAWGKASESPLFTGQFFLPLEEIKVMEEFGIKRNYGNNESIHPGVDLKAQRENVYAINDGIVLLTQEFSREGNVVAIDHGGGIISLYLHLSVMKAQVGQMVKRGDIIGISGSTGNTTGNHLHFAIKVNQEVVDPLEFIMVVNAQIFGGSSQ